MPKFSIFSFFAGAGFLDLGFEKAGHKIVFVNEIYPPFLTAYKYARNTLDIPKPRYGYHSGDMAELVDGFGREMLSGYIAAAREEGEIIGFIGGPPCPDFSIAGRNRGRNGKYGKLSKTYTILVRQQKPDFFLFENVKGLWRTKKHRKFYEELKGELQKSGYITTECLKNALEYGIAQDRDRIILVGFRKELFAHKKPHGSILESFPWSKGIKFSREQIKEFKLKRKTSAIPAQLTVDFWFKKNKVSVHPNAKHHFKPHAIEKFLNTVEGDVSRKSFKRLHRYCYSPTAAYGNNEVHLHPTEARRISAAEALAIQSLPNEFSFPADMTLTDMFKAIGNGVPFIPARTIAESISEFLERQHLSRGTV